MVCDVVVLSSGDSLGAGFGLFVVWVAASAIGLCCFLSFDLRCLCECWLLFNTLCFEF